MRSSNSIKAWRRTVLRAHLLARGSLVDGKACVSDEILFGDQLIVVAASLIRHVAIHMCHRVNVVLQRGFAHRVDGVSIPACASVHGGGIPDIISSRDLVSAVHVVVQRAVNSILVWVQQ